MRDHVANILVVLLLFFLGQDLHVCGVSAERSETRSLVRMIARMLFREESFVGESCVVRKKRYCMRLDGILVIARWKYDGNVRAYMYAIVSMRDRVDEAHQCHDRKLRLQLPSTTSS